MLPAAKEYGFELTEEDLQPEEADERLSLDDLSESAGGSRGITTDDLGNECMCALGGGSRGDDGKPCGCVIYGSNEGFKCPIGGVFTEHSPAFN